MNQIKVTARQSRRKAESTQVVVVVFLNIIRCVFLKTDYGSIFIKSSACLLVLECLFVLEFSAPLESLDNDVGRSRFSKMLHSCFPRLIFKLLLLSDQCGGVRFILTD